MAQGNVEFTKKVNYQIGKTDYADVILDDIQKVQVAQHILNAQINAGDLVTDIEMPIGMLGAELDWDEGVLDDLLVGIASGPRLTIIQDLADENVRVGYQDHFSFDVNSPSEAGFDFTFPSRNGYIIDAIIDWGDDTQSDITTWNDPNLVHNYTGLFDGTITVKGVCEFFQFTWTEQNVVSLNEVINLTNLRAVGFGSQTGIGDGGQFNVHPSWWQKWAIVEDFSYLFYNCGISEIPTSLFSNCTSATTFYRAFSGNPNITTIPDGLFDDCTSTISFEETFKDIGITEIPVDLFKYIPDVLNNNRWKSTFNGCGDLTTIPADLFRYHTLATTFSGTFFYCTSLVEIPAGLFDYNTDVTSFTSLFYGCSSLTTIPAELFRYNILAKTFLQTFRYCTSVTTIPPGMFDYHPDVTYFREVFAGTGITSIPDNWMDNMPLINNVYQLFNNCSSLTTIPAELFRYNTLIENAIGIFQNCTSLVTIPTGLFDYNTEVIDFSNAFSGDSVLTTIPADLFRYNTKVTNFSAVFYNDVELTSLPTGLFDNCSSATNFSNSFRFCSLTSLPADLFDDCTAAIEFDYCFQNNNIRTIPDNLFDSCTLATEFNYCFGGCSDLYDVPDELFRYTTSADNFEDCFGYCTVLSGSVTGTGELQTWMASHSPSAAWRCFQGCTGIQDWDLIPVTWGGGGLAALTNNMNLTIHGQDPTTWDFTLPINNIANTGMDIEITWGDGTSNTFITDYTSSDAIHTYTNGEVDNTLNIKGKLSWLDFTNSTEPGALVETGTVSRDLGLTQFKINYCANLTSVNSGLKEHRQLESIASFFRGCTSLTTVPGDIFDYAYSANHLYDLFKSCSSFDTIPSGLFDNCISTLDFDGVFFGTSITSIPTDLFKYNTLVTDFDATFSYTDITSIPADLFKYNTAVISFTATFNNCTSLATIPADLFRYNTLVNGLSVTFSSCTSIINLPADLFLYNTAITTINNCFKNSNSITTAVTGVNDLIDQVETNNSGVSKTGCFDGCTSITDYASIPIGASDWRTY
ncbi:MAG: hypothetical protein DRJ01_00525 [Bacteroidetes bacterium]|nr:MAG: hypothetical protein DRJ01_00525 [Bacteroidota bacterium]